MDYDQIFRNIAIKFCKENNIENEEVINNLTDLLIDIDCDNIDDDDEELIDDEDDENEDLVEISR